MTPQLTPEVARRILQGHYSQTVACQKYLSYFPLTGPLRRELYPKQMEFFESGARFRERAFVAANRIGKSEAGSYEVALHLTGKYPPWWKGRRFTKPTRIWAAGDTNQTVRDILQAKLFGRIARGLGDDPREVTGLGTGMIPGECIVGKPRPRSGVPDAIESCHIRHVAGVSHIALKSYEQGREAFQGTEQEIIWLDEEVPEDIYQECLIRTMTTGGMILLTFTPLNGLTPVVLQFMPGGQIPSREDQLVQDNTRYVVACTWDDVPHLTEESKKSLWASIPPYQRDARARGIPQLGSGAIYPVPESDIVVAPREFPDSWRRCFGMDVGWNRTAVIWIAEDPDTRIWYAYSEHYIGRTEPTLQAAAIKGRGDWIPGVIDPAANGRGQKDGSQLFQDYKDLGLKLEKAQNGVETGLYQVWQLLSGGQLKIFSTMQNTLSEYRVYRRDERGHVVKKDDHAMDALRYAVVSGRDLAKPKKIEQKVVKSRLYSSESSNNGWMSG